MTSHLASVGRWRPIRPGAGSGMGRSTPPAMGRSSSPAPTDRATCGSLTASYGTWLLGLLDQTKCITSRRARSDVSTRLISSCSARLNTPRFMAPSLREDSGTGTSRSAPMRWSVSVPPMPPVGSLRPRWESSTGSPNATSARSSAVSSGLTFPSIGFWIAVACWAAWAWGPSWAQYVLVAWAAAGAQALLSTVDRRLNR